MENVLPISPVEEGLLAYVKDGEEYTLAIVDGDGNIIMKNPDYDFPEHISGPDELERILDARSDTIDGNKVINIGKGYVRIDNEKMSFAGKTGEKFDFSAGNYYVGWKGHYILVPENTYKYGDAPMFFMALETTILKELIEHGKAKLISRPGDVIGEVSGNPVYISEDLKEIRIGKHVFPTDYGIIPAAAIDLETFAEVWCTFEEKGLKIHSFTCEELDRTSTRPKDIKNSWKIIREVKFAALMKKALGNNVTTLVYPSDFDKIYAEDDKIVAEYGNLRIKLKTPEELWDAAYQLSTIRMSFSIIHPREGYIKNGTLWITGEITGKTVRMPAPAVAGLLNSTVSSALLGKPPIDLSNIPCNELEYIDGIPKRSPLSRGIYRFRCVETGAEYTITL